MKGFLITSGFRLIELKYMCRAQLVGYQIRNNTNLVPKMKFMTGIEKTIRWYVSKGAK
ncbi:hypothetical protein N8Z67_01670 [Amylibacter sp.]|nr:hypothetical protein [Amylibacter sp.]MDC1376442.1 hypothetical protein [Amylibacter sp.]